MGTVTGYCKREGALLPRKKTGEILRYDCQYLLIQLHFN